MAVPVPLTSGPGPERPGQPGRCSCRQPGPSQSAGDRDGPGRRGPPSRPAPGGPGSALRLAGQSLSHGPANRDCPTRLPHCGQAESDSAHHDDGLASPHKKIDSS
jgi:hypothetical protein